MSSFKKLSKSDVTVVPYHANKQWNLSYCPYPTSSTYLTIYKGTNIVNSIFSTESDPVTEGQYERLVYSQINQLYYQDYTASLNTHSLANSIYYESASVQRPTSSYFIYNDSANLISNFPTGANEGIRVLSVNQDIYGNKLLPHNFILTSSAYKVSDDGYGNLYDTKTTKTHIGNIFYAQGLAIITNQDYQLMFPLPPLAVNDIAYFLTATSPKVVSPLSNDSGRGGTLLTSSLSLSGSASELSYWTNNGDGTITLTTSLTGSYIAYYTVEASYSCGNIVSNKAKVTAIVAPTTTTTTTTTTSTTTTTTTPPPTTTTTTTTSTTTSTTTPPPTTTTTSTTTTTTTPEPTTTTTTTSTTTTTTTEGIATFDGDFTLCVASGSTEDFRALDNSIVGGHFATTSAITANNCSGPVDVTGSLTSGQGALKIAIPSVPVGATAIVVAQGIGATNATITTGSVGSVFELIITPNSYPTTVILNGTITVTY
jgi:hypothetical protein